MQLIFKMLQYYICENHLHITVGHCWWNWSDWKKKETKLFGNVYYL